MNIIVPFVVVLLNLNNIMLNKDCVHNYISIVIMIIRIIRMQNSNVKHVTDLEHCYNYNNIIINITL